MKKVVKPSVSYGNSYLDKKKTTAKREESKIDNESNGVMKKFISLDDIPDIDSNPSSNRGAATNNAYNRPRDIYQVNNSNDQYQNNFSDYREPQLHGGKLSINTNGNRFTSRDDDEGDVGYYVKPSPKFGPPLQLSPKVRPSSGSMNSARSFSNNVSNTSAAPPLPYELKQMSEVPKLRSPVRNAPKVSYDAADDDDDDWTNMTPPHSPHKPVVYSSKLASFFFLQSCVSYCFSL